MKSTSSFLSLLLIPLLSVLPVLAQSDNPTGVIQIRTQGAQTSAVLVNSKSVNNYIIVITDGSGVAISNAAIALRLPDDGPGGTFANGSKAVVLYTDDAGQAKFPEVLWGATPGTAVVRLTVVKGALRAGALIEQSIVATGAVTASAAPVASAAPTNLASSPLPPAPQYVVSPHTKVATVPRPTVPGTPASPRISPPQSASTATTPQPQTVASAKPNVSVTNAAGTTGGGAAHPALSAKKWILIAAVAAGASVGAALAFGGHGGAAAATTPAGLTIGTPTLSVGH